MKFLSRQFEERQISPAPSRYICSSSCSIRWSNGIIYCPINSQRFRKGTLGNQRVHRKQYPLISSNFSFFAIFQKWLRNLRRSFLETRCTSILHPRSTLAWCGIPTAFRTKTEANGVRYDWIVYTANGKCLSIMVEENRYFYINGLYYSLGNVRDGKCYSGRQKSVLQVVRCWRNWCCKDIFNLQFLRTCISSNLALQNISSFPAPIPHENWWPNR